jgi:hypothetical protein
MAWLGQNARGIDLRTSMAPDLNIASGGGPYRLFGEVLTVLICFVVASTTNCCQEADLNRRKERIASYIQLDLPCRPSKKTTMSSESHRKALSITLAGALSQHIGADAIQIRHRSPMTPAASLSAIARASRCYTRFFILQSVRSSNMKQYLSTTFKAEVIEKHQWPTPLRHRLRSSDNMACWYTFLSLAGSLPPRCRAQITTILKAAWPASSNDSESLPEVKSHAYVTSPSQPIITPPFKASYESNFRIVAAT